MARLALKLLAWSLLAVTSVVTSADRTRTDSYWFERELHESEGYLRVKRTDVNPPFKEIERRSNLTLETFLREYARVGKPVVVTDGTKDWDFARASKWTARSLKKAYPKDVHNRRPRIGEEIFDDNGRLIFRITEERFHAMLPDLMREEAAMFHQRMHVSWLNRNPRISNVLKQSYELPYFFRGLAEYASGEYFFLGQRETQGREKHIDYSCNSTWSAQLNGRKIWRLFSPSHPQSVLMAESGADDQGDDGEAYETLLMPGEIIVWYPGWSHSTFSVDQESSAMSVEFRMPPPTPYLKKYMHLFRAHDDKLDSFGRCFPLWEHREKVYEDMRKENFSEFRLCEPSTYPGGDCRFFTGAEATTFDKELVSDNLYEDEL